MHVVKHKSGGCRIVGGPCNSWLSLEETSTQTSDEEAVQYMKCHTHIHHSDNVDTVPFETSRWINPATQRDIQKGQNSQCQCCGNLMPGKYESFSAEVTHALVVHKI
jgi:hypothetical protein